MNPEPETVVAMTTIVQSRICGVPTPGSVNGELCKNHTTRWFEDTGWRCRFHVPEGKLWPAGQRDIAGKDVNGNPLDLPAKPTDMPNDGRITNIKSALDAIAWATENLMSGALTESRARGVINGARQYMRGIATTAGADLMNDLERGAVEAGVLPKQK